MKRLIYSICFVILTVCSFAQITINEVQTSNSKTIYDEDFYKYKDWVELYNTSSSSVNIGGYYISDDKDEPRKWQIPSGQSIAAKGYLLIWTDGEDITGKQMHTNFKLSNGDVLFLYTSTMFLVDSVTIVDVEPDYTYGRITDGTGNWSLLSSPTPKATNVSTTVRGLAPKPVFSKSGGFYTGSQSISLSTDLSGAVIRYTTDGTEPTESSPVYSSAITAAKVSETSYAEGYNKANSTNVMHYDYNSASVSYNSIYDWGTVDKGFVLKAKVFHDDYIPSNTVCQTYFINMTKPSLPVISLVTDKANFFSADSGIYIKGTNGVYRGGGGDVKANWNNEDWERQVYVEYFDKNGTRQFGANAAARVMGAVSRHTELKSLNIIMRKQYEEGPINYPIFGEDGLQSYYSFILRNSGNDWEQGPMARDAMIQSIVRGAVDLETQDYQPVVMFLNGEYWSFINMRERYDENYFAGYYDYADADNLDVLKINGDDDCFNASEGDSLRYEEMMAYLATNSMSDDDNYQYVKSHYLDVDNMITYYIVQLFCQNTDWPNNNFRLWRPRTENGKFRFPLYDTDFGYGLWGGSASTNPFSNFDTDKDIITVKLFYYMMENDDFKSEFIQRFYYMMNTVFDSERSSEIINNIENTISTERATSDKKWYRSSSAAYSSYLTSSVVSFAESRVGYMKDYLNTKYGSKGTTTLTVNYTSTQGSVKLCGVDVESGYSGVQYKSTPIRLTAEPLEGYQFVGWKNGNTTVSTDQEYSLTITSTTTIQAVFESRSTVSGLKINEILASNSTTKTNELGEYEDWIEIYNTTNSAIDLAGLYISDDPSNPTLWKIPYGYTDSTTIPATGYLLFWADNEYQEGPMHLPFKLNKSGDTLILSQVSSSGTVTTIDQLIYGDQNTDVSYGCYPDASTNKIVFTLPTPKAANTIQSTNFLTEGDLVINEIMAKNSSTIMEETGTYADWFEVYNTTNSDIDMGGLFVTNNIENPNMYLIPKGQSSLTTVPAKGYLVFWADKQTAINPNHVDFKLNAESGDLAIVQLQGATNMFVDQMSYTNQGEDLSYGRYPSGTGNFIYMVNATPEKVNASNGTISLISGITINEVLAQNTATIVDENGLYSDFVEFYNNSDAAIDLGGLFISDSTGYSLRYRIPTTNSSLTTVKSDDWIGFWADDSSSLGENHLGFSFDVLGEDVVLSQIASDGTIHQIDAVTYTTQSPNVSYGRYLDGSDNWELMSPTYEAANQSYNSSTALKTLTTSTGNITPTIATNIVDYVCELPAGTSSVPTIAATAVNDGATVTITQASSLNDKAIVSVISKNGIHTQEYTVSFIITESSDATLKSLVLAGGTLSPTFSSSTYSYTAAITTTTVPYVTAIPNNANSMVEIEYASTISDNTIITVTAENGDTQTYTITYTVATSQNIVTEWTDDFTDGIDYLSTETDQYIISQTTETTGTGMNKTTEYGALIVLNEDANDTFSYVEYHLPTGYVLDGSSALNVSMDITAATAATVLSGVTIESEYVSFNVGLVDVYGNVSNYVAYSTTVNSTTESITMDMSSAGGVTNYAIVAVRLALYGPSDELKARAKAVYVDNLVIGPKTASGSQVIEPLSSSAVLATLSSSIGTLSPTVANATKSYTLTLTAGTTTIPVISATATDATATVEIAQAADLNGTAYVRIISEDLTVVNEFEITLNLLPSVVDGYTDYIIQPEMKGWTESSNLYALTYSGGQIEVDYERTSNLSDAVTYTITDAANKILNLSEYPYASVSLKTDVATTLYAELFDVDGNVSAVTTATCEVGSEYVVYTFDFTDNFSEASNTEIYGLNMYFDKGSSSSLSGTITLEELKFGSDVEIIVNNAPEWTTISNKTIQQGESFTNINLYDFVSDDLTTDSNLTLSVSSGGENLIILINSGIASITVKDAEWVGTETITFKAIDEGSKYSTVSVSFTVEELKIAVESVIFTSASVSVAQNNTVDLSSYLTIAPEDATIESIVWSISDSDAASINTSGVLTNNLDYGTETITATVVVTDKNANIFTKTISVELTGCPTKISQVIPSSTSLDLYYDETSQLTYTLSTSSGEEACEKSVTYSSSNTDVATISTTGLITAKETAGSTTITIMVNDGFSVKTGTCLVSVSKDCSGDITLSLDKTVLSIKEGDEATITASITPDDECTESNEITWTSSKTSVATVTNGLVTAVAEGSTTITATTSGNGTTVATCVVTVNKNCVSESIDIALSSTSETLYLTSNPITLTPTINTSNVCDETLLWSVSPTDVVSVVEGVITPLKYGTATVKVYSNIDESSYKECVVQVVEKEVSKVTLSSTNLSLYIGDKDTLIATINPEDADNKDITWTSSNTSVATVVNGIVTSLAEGSATITATANSGVYATCLVTVSPIEITGIQLSSSEVILTTGEQQQITVTFTPSNATDKTLTWTSDDENIVTVSNGLIVAKAEGSATITVTTENNITKTISVTVQASIIAVESVSVLPQSLSLNIGDIETISATITPNDATNQSLTWTSDDESVATVSSEGVVTAIAAGSATITVSSVNGKTATVDVEVSYRELSSVSFSETTLALAEDNMVDLSDYMVLNPVSTEVKTIVWSVSGSSATISNAGVLKNNLEYGSQTVVVTVTVTDMYGTVKTSEINVELTGCETKITSIQLNTSDIEIKNTETSQLKVTTTPTVACIEYTNYESNNEAVATVSAAGLIQAQGEGSTVVTVTVSDGYSTFTKEVNVKVYIDVESVAFTSASYTKYIGDVFEITPTITPSNATYQTITWTSSNESVATIDANGEITALTEGTTTITATTPNNESASCVVYVKAVDVTDFTLSATTLSLNVYDEETLTATISPENATDKTITWTSSNESIATIDENGLVTAKKSGDCIITATSSNNKTKSCVVTISDILPTSISVSSSACTLDIDKSIEIEVTFTPANVTDTTITWTSSNESIATVLNGKITAVSAGTATITVSTSNNVTKTITVTVNPMLATSINLNTTLATLKQNEQQTLIASILPDNTTDKTVTWTSSDASIVSVDTKGKITANALGEAIITATTANGLSATCSVVVTLNTIAVSGVEVTPSETEILIGSTSSLNAVITPTTATNKSIVWSSSKSTIVSVDQNGNITANAIGTAIIIATSANSISDSCIVTVKEIEVTSISISENITLAVGETSAVTPTILPSTATNQTVTWTVKDNSIATVTSAGKITGVAVGSTYVYAETSNGLVDSVLVTIEETAIPVQYITSLTTVVYVQIGESKDLTSQIEFSPANATNKGLTWAITKTTATYGDDVVATISNGIVSGVAAGTVQLRVSSVSASASTSITIIVSPIKAVGIVVNPESKEMVVDATYQLESVLSPSTVSCKTIEWTTSDETIATVSTEGLITAIKAGQVTITAKTTDGTNLSATCNVTVTDEPIESLTPSVSLVELEIGYMKKITLTVNPSTASTDNIVWSSSNSDVATVSSTGQITAVSAGTAIITATASSGASCQITCNVKSENNSPLLLSEIPSQIINKGETFSNINLYDYFFDIETSTGNLLWLVDAGGTNISVNVTSTGVASVSVNDANWVGSQVVTFYAVDEQFARTSAQVEFTILGTGSAVETVTLQSSMLVYPNPATDFVTLSIETNSVENCIIELFTIQGVKVFENTVKVNGSYSKLYNLSYLVKGNYLLVVTTEHEKKTMEIVLK